MYSEPTPAGPQSAAAGRTRPEGEAREALTASERTQSNEAAPGSRCLTKRASSARAASNAPGSGLPLFRAYLKSQSPKSPKSPKSEESEVQDAAKRRCGADNVRKVHR